MCEWLNKCPNTGVDIENAPCKAMEKIMNVCQTNISQTIEAGIPITNPITRTAQVPWTDTGTAKSFFNTGWIAYRNR